MSNTSLSTFPSSKISALTMLYLQNQDLSNLSPEELLDKYDEVYQKILEFNYSKKKAASSKLRK